MRMFEDVKLGLLICALGLVSSACGGVQYPHRAGFYRGPNQLDFQVQRPVVRTMPPERHVGSVRVIDTGDLYVTFQLRIFGEGEMPCQLQARRRSDSSGQLDIVSGQRCSSRFRYDGRPLIAVIEVDHGLATFMGPMLRIQIQGPFSADVQTASGVVPADGFSTWIFEGRVSPQ